METVTSSTTASNVRMIQNAFDNFGKGNIAAIIDECSDDVIWASYNNPDVPYSGNFHGKEGVMEFFKKLSETIHYSNFEPKEFIGQADRVMVLGHHTGTVIKTGKSFDHDWAMSFKIRDNKVQDYFAFVDSRDQAQAFKS